MAPPRKTKGRNMKLKTEEESQKELEGISSKLLRIKSFKSKAKKQAEFKKLKIAKDEAKREMRKRRKKERKELGDQAPPVKMPQTIENKRIKDETMVDPEDEEVQFDEMHDEMSSYFNKEKEPKVFITTSERPYKYTVKFCKELSESIPNSEVKFRRNASVKGMVERCIADGYTDLIVINEDRKRPNGLLLIHLPEGPTALFKISNVKLGRGKGKKMGEKTGHRPEVMLNNFNTRLGHTIGRMLASIFHYDPEFKGRSVVTFHNQRDFIFFRHHRYEFRNTEKVSILELGPRFTLKLRYLQKGTFNTKFGDFEWFFKRHEMEDSRRRFQL